MMLAQNIWKSPYLAKAQYVRYLISVSCIKVSKDIYRSSLFLSCFQFLMLRKYPSEQISLTIPASIVKFKKEDDLDGWL